MSATKAVALERAIQLVNLRGARVVLESGLAGAVDAEAQGVVDAASRRDDAEEVFLLTCSKHGVSPSSLFDSGIEKRVPSGPLSECRDAKINFDRCLSALDVARLMLERRVGQVLSSPEALAYVREQAAALEQRLAGLGDEVNDIARRLTGFTNLLIESPDLRERQNVWKAKSAATFANRDHLAPLREDAQRLGRI